MEPVEIRNQENWLRQRDEIRSHVFEFRYTENFGKTRNSIVDSGAEGRFIDFRAHLDGRDG